jgi:hypothetical protein
MVLTKSKGASIKCNNIHKRPKRYNNNSLLNVQFGSLLGPRGLLLIYIWGENST